MVIIFPFWLQEALKNLLKSEEIPEGGFLELNIKKWGLFTVLAVILIVALKGE